MNTMSGDNWTKDIRRQVLQLIAILVSLVIVAAGYNYISRYAIDNFRDANNNYHLLATTSYLRATQALQSLENQLFSPSINLHSPRDVHPSTLHHLITDSIEEGLKLEEKFRDPRFKYMRIKLESRLRKFDALYPHQPGSLAKEQLKTSTDNLQQALDQMSRLHTVTRRDRLQELKEKERFHTVAFYVLITSLSLVAALIARRGFASINRIIREQVSVEEKVKFQAFHDQLTGLPNRVLALDRLAQMMAQANRDRSRVAVLFIDLDFFKKVNDLLGHAGGDKLLQEVAQRLQSTLRSGDTVGRLGGDEFIVLIPSMSSADDVRPISEKLIRQLNEPYVIDNKEFELSASVGISVYPDDGEDKLELIRKADSAMYYSKEAGRNTSSYFTDSMNQRISRQLAVEEQLRGALDRDEFRVFYQQKVDLSTGRIIGAEALLRWTSAALGPVSPQEFIPIAEQTGLILPIGEFVLREALSMTRRWRERLHPDFRIAVNLSPRQFRDSELINQIARSLHEFGVPSGSLELEITEGVLMSDNLHIDQSLADLTSLGVSIAMDDFGTGYSSLSYLRKYPFGVIKIDREFIRDIDENAMSLELNQAAIAMAHALDIKVVAEGIETKSQLDVLTGLRCDIGQGYYFGRPVAAAHITGLLEAQKMSGRSGDVIHFADIPAPNSTTKPQRGR